MRPMVGEGSPDVTWRQPGQLCRPALPLKIEASTCWWTGAIFAAHGEGGSRLSALGSSEPDMDNFANERAMQSGRCARQIVSFSPKPPR